MNNLEGLSHTILGPDNQVFKVVERANNPALFAYQLGLKIVELRGQVDEATIQKFNEAYLQSARAVHGITIMALTGCIQTLAGKDAARQLYHQWSIYEPSQRDPQKLETIQVKYFLHYRIDDPDVIPT